jgi:hypothetical protein
MKRSRCSLAAALVFAAVLVSGCGKNDRSRTDLFLSPNGLLVADVWNESGGGAAGASADFVRRSFALNLAGTTCRSRIVKILNSENAGGAKTRTFSVAHTQGIREWRPGGRRTFSAATNIGRRIA